jgi:hypothetical protein
VFVLSLGYESPDMGVARLVQRGPVKYPPEAIAVELERLNQRVALRASHSTPSKLREDTSGFGVHGVESGLASDREYDRVTHGGRALLANIGF